MKNIILAMCLATCSFSLVLAQKSPKAPPAETVELKDVIERINAALAEAQKSPEAASLLSATIKLETAYDKSGGGGFKVFAKASRKWAKGASSSVTYKYSTPITITSLESKNDELVAIIKDAAKNFKNNSSIAGLEKDKFEIEIAFSVTKTSSAGVEFEVYGVGVDISGDSERKVAHTITLEFK
jgi:hypothetical protein